MRELELKVSRTSWTPGPMFLVTMFASIATACDSGTGTQLGQADGQGGADIGPMTCSTAAECPAPSNPCEVAACVANVCSGVPAPAGTFVPAEAQVAGDCKEFTCGEGGALTTRAAPNDLPADDGNPCTSEVCDGPNPIHPPQEVGTPCGDDGICNTTAVCAECVPGAGGCERDVPRSCDDDGLWVSEAACPFVCQGAAVCGGECKPGARDCSGRQPRVCNDAGTWQNEGDICAFACTAGACAGSCLPGAIQCNGQVPQSCDAAGAWQPSDACLFACIDGLCTGLCRPGANRCQGVVAQSCDANGTWTTTNTCPYLCQNGACGGICAPGGKRCVGRTSQDCDANGQWADSQTCAFACEAGLCTGVCQPGATRCNNNQAQVCDSQGQWQTSESCTFACLGTGTCGGVCTPGASRCNGNNADVCDSNGQWTSTTCTFACQNGGCTGICNPGDKRCNSNNSQTCSASGQWTTTQTCPFVCSGAGTCGGQCAPSTTRCSGTTPQSCDGAGNWSSLTDCTFACVNGGCTGLCRPGDVRCVGLASQTCDSTGQWQTSEQCQFACDAGRCSGVCAPGSNRCSANAPETCNEAGQWLPGATCADGWSCRSGACVIGQPCPEAVITVAQGDEVLLGTILALSAADSMPSSDSPITRWQWSVVQPSGSMSNFAPSASVQDVTFEVNRVGEYQFSLKVWDAAGVESCTEATYTVFVSTDAAIHVELFWDTPGDGDQTNTGFDFFGNSVGTDLDLHFLHPSANNAWFHSLYDCNWLNINPNWGESGELDNPRLTRDDTDGAGPETLLLASPEFGKTYRIGAHYWDDWGFGPSFATIRVYMYGELRFEWERVNVVMNDMWDVATIAWPAQTVTRVTTATNGPVITPNFSSGFFP